MGKGLSILNGVAKAMNGPKSYKANQKPSKPQADKMNPRSVDDDESGTGRGFAADQGNNVKADQKDQGIGRDGGVQSKKSQKQKAVIAIRKGLQDPGGR